jgi:hypothetical protein
VPELPLARVDILGEFHVDMPMNLRDPIVDLFTPGRGFADYEILGHVVGIRREVHRAEYDGDICALKVFPNLANNMKAFMRDVSIRYKLQTSGLPIVPVDAVFTEGDHSGTGYMQMRFYEQDLMGWASKPRSVEDLRTVLQKVGQGGDRHRRVCF